MPMFSGKNHKMLLFHMSAPPAMFAKHYCVDLGNLSSGAPTHSSLVTQFLSTTYNAPGPFASFCSCPTSHTEESIKRRFSLKGQEDIQYITAIVNCYQKYTFRQEFVLVAKSCFFIWPICDHSLTYCWVIEFSAIDKRLGIGFQSIP